MYADTSVQSIGQQYGGKKTQQPWWELVETMWNSQEGKTLWMSSVLEAHKVSSVLSNLVPMVTNTQNSSSNTKIMSKRDGTAITSINTTKTVIGRVHILKVHSTDSASRHWRRRWSAVCDLNCKPDPLWHWVSLPGLFWERGLLRNRMCVAGVGKFTWSEHGWTRISAKYSSVGWNSMCWSMQNWD